MLMKLLLLMGLSSAAFAACLPVAGSRVLGRDLALADPRFAALPATLAVGFAPQPGVKRIFTAAELQRIARANGLRVPDGSPDPADICFELPMRPLTLADATAAMRRSLPADAELTVEELSKSDLPEGQPEFPTAGLEPSAPGAQGVQLWRGYVRYADTQKASCWARVKLTAHYTVVVAAKDLPPGHALEAALLRLETKTGPLDREPAAARIEEVRGRALKRPLKAGSPVPLGILVEPFAVLRGDAVRVEVRSGPALLHFEAFAEAPAREGDMIELHNPVTGKTFRARLAAGQQAVLVVGEGQI
jgi:flagella basal body P-ring formation protein FlgA